ncbi:MAG: hypothetical protein JW829_04615, partial [Pirellulales bacterium]|nr:hypothetical protein [Pirellulales bacterium]
MGVLDQIRQEKALREAEGYLEFGMPAHAIRVLTALGPCIATNGLASYLLGEALREQARYKEALVPLER